MSSDIAYPQKAFFSNINIVMYFKIQQYIQYRLCLSKYDPMGVAVYAKRASVFGLLQVYFSLLLNCSAISQCVIALQYPIHKDRGRMYN